MTKERKAFDAVKLTKTIDPVLQSALLVFFIFSLDERVSYYKTIYFIVLALQVISWLYNMVVPFRKKLKIERYIYIVAIAVWGISYYYTKTHVHEKYFVDRDFRMLARTGIYDFSFMAIGLLLMGWYSLICFREIRGTLKRRFKD